MSSARSPWFYAAPVVLMAGAIVYFSVASSGSQLAIDSAKTAPSVDAGLTEQGADGYLSAEQDSELQRQIDDLRSQLAELSESKQPEPGTEPAELAQEGPATDVAEAWQSQLQELDELAGTEEVDEAWASSAEVTLSSAFSASAAPSMSLGDVHCRSSICKIQLTADVAEEQAIIESFENFQPWEGGQILLNIDPETGVGQVYVARTGASLPGMGVAGDSRDSRDSGDSGG